MTDTRPKVDRLPLDKFVELMLGIRMSPQQREIAALLEKHGSTMAAQVAPWRVRQWEEWFAQRDRTKP